MPVIYLAKTWKCGDFDAIWSFNFLGKPFRSSLCIRNLPGFRRISSKAYYQLARKKIYWRLFIANVGFVCAFGILAPLVILLLVKTDHIFRYIMKTSFKKRSKKSFATATDFWVEYVLFNFIKYISLFINCHEFQEYKS